MPRSKAPKDGRYITPRDLEILLLAKEGKTSKEISALLFISNRTVSYHLYEISRRCGTHNKVQSINLIGKVPVIDLRGMGQTKPKVYTDPDVK